MGKRAPEDSVDCCKLSSVGSFELAHGQLQFWQVELSSGVCAGELTVTLLVTGALVLELCEVLGASLLEVVVVLVEVVVVELVSG